MSTNKLGSIPENLVLFSQPEKKVRFRWDDIEGDAGEEFKVFATFVTDAKNKKTQESARKWASAAQWDYSQNKALPTSTPIVTDLKNDPIKDVRIVTLEHRGNGGRAYKVIVNGKFYVDLREDVLLDSILQVGIGKGGQLKGEYIFAMVNSEMKLIRVGSLLHKKMIEANAFDKAKPIKYFEIGGVYGNKRGDKMLYLGEFNTSELELEYDHQGYGFGRKSIVKSAKKTNERSYHAFYNIMYLGRDLGNGRGRQAYSSYYLTLSANLSKSYKEKLDQLDIDPYTDKPFSAAESIKLIVADAENKISGKNNDTAGTVAYYAKELNLSKEVGFVHPLVKKILDKK